MVNGYPVHESIAREFPGNGRSHGKQETMIMMSPSQLIINAVIINLHSFANAK